MRTYSIIAFLFAPKETVAFFGSCILIGSFIHATNICVSQANHCGRCGKTAVKKSGIFSHVKLQQSTTAMEGKMAMGETVKMMWRGTGWDSVPDSVPGACHVEEVMFRL